MCHKIVLAVKGGYAFFADDIHIIVEGLLQILAVHVKIRHMEHTDMKKVDGYSRTKKAETQFVSAFNFENIILF